MGSKKSSDGSNAIGGFIFVVIVLVVMIPKPVWIFLGVLVGGALLSWLIYWLVKVSQERRAAAEERERVERAQRAAAAKREREERARKEKQHRIQTLGKDNAARVESAQADIQKITSSEAARAGWLGDVDFTADVTAITDNFAKVHALRKVTNRLAAIDKPSADDRRILAEARKTAAGLERAGIERVELISKCAKEAQLIDKSLRAERKEARDAAERAELHSKLSGMLYGIEATAHTPAPDSAVDAVMARVQAYREIKNQIQLARDAEAG